jgi:cyclopropane fatty-acyl-phospholipid synthase-like methyltransferase
MTNAWEALFKRGKFVEMEPHPEMSNIAELFEKEKVNRILDLGSGRGRHLLYLAEKGFDVYGLDSSPAGLVYTIKALSEKKLSAHLTISDMTSLPYDEYFDALISIQVIHHNKIKDIQNTVKEMTRVLKNGGLLWVTVPVSKNEPSNTQREIEPQTFIPLDGIEKGLPHHYFKMEEIPPLFAKFSVIDIHIDEVNHFSCLARKLSL